MAGGRRSGARGREGSEGSPRQPQEALADHRAVKTDPNSKCAQFSSNFLAVHPYALLTANGARVSSPPVVSLSIPAPVLVAAQDECTDMGMAGLDAEACRTRRRAVQP